ncbi:hypothetical protein [Conexibacter sp. SYSU D00693]|uniref:hypothetical protein n=1 Tax=Conexibacter sp. SYSU D00693 TaxID=2812560 RepID=UPI00196A3A31|nr:hypothetical protein [Conexibacter sp. SYSU D00693]
MESVERDLESGGTPGAFDDADDWGDDDELLPGAGDEAGARWDDDLFDDPED